MRGRDAARENPESTFLMCVLGYWIYSNGVAKVHPSFPCSASLKESSNMTQMDGYYTFSLAVLILSI